MKTTKQSKVDMGGLWLALDTAKNTTGSGRRNAIMGVHERALLVKDQMPATQRDAFFRQLDDAFNA